MVFQRDKGTSPDPIQAALPPAESGEDVPRWLVVLGLVAGLTLLVALLRYAIDLLGVVFVIILIGFAIRALSDWLTEGEAVSGWALSALSFGLIGTMLVGLWLVNSHDPGAHLLEDRLPGPLHRSVGWLETKGWGQRVLLSGDSPSGAPALEGAQTAKSGPVEAAELSSPSEPGEPLAMVPPLRSAPALPASPKAQARRPRAGSRGGPGEAEAAQAAGPVAPPLAAAPAEPAPVLPTTIELTASPATAVVGRSVRLTAQVRASGGETSPTGTVTFLAGSRILGRATVRNGTAVLVTLDLPLGDHLLSAEYSGDPTHLPGRSASIAKTIVRK